MRQYRDMLNQRERNEFGEGMVILAALLLLFLLCNLYFTKTFIAVFVDGNSMDSTLRDGNYLYADTTASPERGDIVVIDVTGVNVFMTAQDWQNYHDNAGRKFIIKRVIALGGDRVLLSGGKVYVCYQGEEEFTELDEPYATGDTYPLGGGKEFTVGEGQIFFLGDNREASLDARASGSLDASGVVGVVPKWSVAIKQVITGWENFRTLLFGSKP